MSSGGAVCVKSDLFSSHLLPVDCDDLSLQTPIEFLDKLSWEFVDCDSMGVCRLDPCVMITHGITVCQLQTPMGVSRLCRL